MVVIEDVDLIARERTHMHGPGEEVLLNKLLNEMDGLREDAEVLFILTTNRPDQRSRRWFHDPAESIKRSSFRCRTRRAAVS
jgi:SpoVK/Ycf46/Vps4 family AAA+-type ATPase